MISDKKHGWRISMRSLGLTKEDRSPFSEIILNHCTTERETVKDLRLHHFTTEWWECVLILDVQYLGEVWYEQEEWIDVPRT